MINIFRMNQKISNEVAVERETTRRLVLLEKQKRKGTLEHYTYKCIFTVCFFFAVILVGYFYLKPSFNKNITGKCEHQVYTQEELKSRGIISCVSDHRMQISGTFNSNWAVFCSCE